MSKISFISASILVEKELEKARNQYPKWPVDIVHAAAIVGEEAGELLQASLDATYSDLNHKAVKADERALNEAIQTAAMAIRFICNWPYAEKKDNRQVED